MEIKLNTKSVTYDCVGVGKFIFLAVSAHSSLGLGVSTVGII